jgi:DNA (cytosine-5)-methyltransferase 1
LGFLRLIGELGKDGRAPRLLVIENVTGLLSARGGSDFAALRGALSELGYQARALTIDAADFLPQSRPRVFVVASAEGPVLAPPAPPPRPPSPWPISWKRTPLGTRRRPPPACWPCWDP